MTRTASTMTPLGISAPHFSLYDVVSEKKMGLTSSQKAKATVIMFICNHCPYVKHVSKELIRLANDYISQDVQFIAINSNDVESYPDDSPANMKKTALAEKYPFPYLYDETQEVAKAYNAACTPDFFVFDSNLTLVYRGQLDDSRPGNQIPVTGSSIREALDNALTNQPVNEIQIPSLGCNIKWKK
ncbi:MAG: thioredoxin family protein [Legionella sp.]|nr:thioredoxin family protein [Legionella sp.]